MSSPSRLPVRAFIFLFALLAAIPLAAAEIGEALEPGGTSYTRANGESLNLRLVDGAFHLYFLDEAGKITEPTAERVVVQVFESSSSKPDAIVSLTREGPSLTHPHTFVAAKVFRVRLVIPVEDGDAEVLTTRHFVNAEAEN